MSRRRRRALRPAALLALLALGAAGCGTTAATGPAPTTSTTSTTTTTTTTTTTLPHPVGLRGTGRTGAGVASGGAPGPTASFGTVKRILVTPLPDGASEPPTTTTSLPDPPGAVALAYLEVGSGPDLLLVPGEHASMTSWDPAVVQALAQHYTVVLFDYPSVGYSAPDPAIRSVEGLADATAGLAQALGLAEPTVLGLGLGGQVALSLAERHPSLVGRLVLVNTTPGGPQAPRPSPAVAQLLASPSATQAQLLALELVAPADRAALLGRMASYATDDLTTAAIRLEAAVEAASYEDPSVAEGLSRIAAPALVVTGLQDEVVPEEASALLVKGLRRSRQVLVADAGYRVLTGAEARVVGAVEAFTG